MTANDACACHSGSYEDGWHEVRCWACVEVDRAIWADAMERGERVIKEIVAESRAERLAEMDEEQQERIVKYMEERPRR